MPFNIFSHTYNLTRTLLSAITNLSCDIYDGRFTDLRASLCEAEDVVDEEQHILTLLVTEVLCYGQSSQSHSGTGTWGLVHLSVHQRHLAGTRVEVFVTMPQ